MRQQLVRQPHRGGAENEAHEGRNPFDEAHLLGQGDGGRQQGPERSRDHHARGKAEGGIEQTAIDVLEKEDNRGTARGHAPREQRGEERLQDRMKSGEPVGHSVMVQPFVLQPR